MPFSSVFWPRITFIFVLVFSLRSISFHALYSPYLFIILSSSLRFSAASSSPPLLLSIFIRLPSFLLLHLAYLPRGHPQSADYDAGEVSHSTVLWLNLACMNHACGQRSRSEMMARVNVQHSPGPVTSYADFLFLRLCVFDFVSHEWTSTRVRLHIATICLTVEEHGVHVIGLFLYIMNRQCTVTVSYRETLIPLWVCMNQREYSIYKKIFLSTSCLLESLCVYFRFCFVMWFLILICLFNSEPLCVEPLKWYFLMIKCFAVTYRGTVSHFLREFLVVFVCVIKDVMVCQTWHRGSWMLMDHN